MALGEKGNCHCYFPFLSFPELHLCRTHASVSFSVVPGCEFRSTQEKECIHRRRAPGTESYCHCQNKQANCKTCIVSNTGPLFQIQHSISKLSFSKSLLKCPWKAHHCFWEKKFHIRREKVSSIKHCQKHPCAVTGSKHTQKTRRLSSNTRHFHSTFTALFLVNMELLRLALCWQHCR